MNHDRRAAPVHPARRHARAAASNLNRLISTPIALSAPRHQPTFRSGDALTRAVTGKVVLVTGASSRIGAATARLLARHCAIVLLVARNVSDLDRVRSDITAQGGTAHTYPCDLTDFAALDTMVAAVLAEHGRVDVLVNNAGYSIRREVERSQDRFHDFERLIQLNYLAAIRLVLRLLPRMRAEGFGHIINISSWAVQLRPARFAGYTASKAALEAWSDTAQAELQGSGVHFTTIRMPLVRTPMIAPTTLYRHLPALSAEDAAKTVGRAIVSRPRRLSPATTPLLAIATALTPRMVNRIRDSV